MSWRIGPSLRNGNRSLVEKIRCVHKRESDWAMGVAPVTLIFANSFRVRNTLDCLTQGVALGSNLRTPSAFFGFGNSADQGCCLGLGVRRRLQLLRGFDRIARRGPCIQAAYQSSRIFDSFCFEISHRTGASM